MNWAEVAGVAVAIGVASLVQSLSGFGFALLAVPLTSLVVDVRLAVVVSTLVGMATTLVHAWNERSHCDARLARTLIVYSFAGMPFGFAAFLWVPVATMKMVLGVVVIVMSVVLVRGVVVAPDSRTAERVAGLASGVLATSLSTNGPPLVFVLQGRSLSPAQFRGTISRVFSVVNIVTVALFVAAGHVDGASLLIALVAVPVVAISTRIGYLLRPSIDAARFRAMVIVLLVASGISAIVTAL